MKTILALTLISILPTIAVAGPEDRMYETCYKATSAVPAQVPSEFCFESVQLDNEKKFLYPSGYFSNLPDSMAISTFIYKTEDRVSFSAEKRIHNVWEAGCGDGIDVYLKIDGESDITQSPTIDPKALNVKLEVYETNDTCHSHPQETIIEYKLSK